jgi:MFS family permease
MYIIQRFLRLHKFPVEQRKDIVVNAMMHISDGSLFFLAMSFIAMQTIIPVFIQSLGGGAVAIGFLPILWTLGTSLPQIFLKNEKFIPVIKPFVMKIAFYQRFAYLITGVVIILAFPHLPQHTNLILFFMLLSLCAFMGSLSSPNWFYLISKTVPVILRGRVIAIRQLIGSFLGIPSGIVITYILITFHAPYNYGMLFVIFFLISIWSLVFLNKVREFPSEEKSADTSKEKFTIRHLLKSNKNFKAYLAGDIVMQSIFTIVPFFVVYALKRFNLPDAAAGGFTIVYMIGMVVGNIIFGILPDYFGHKVNILAMAASLALASFFAYVSQSIYAFYFVFICSAFANSILGISRLAIILEMVEESKRRFYIAALSSIASPFVLSGLLNGYVIRTYGYECMFVIYTILSIGAFFWVLLEVRDPRAKIR